MRKITKEYYQNVSRIFIHIYKNYLEKIAKLKYITVYKTKYVVQRKTESK